MKLKKLLKDIPVKEIKGSKEIEITGLCSNSKYAAPGNLFVAKKGRVDDGSKYIPEAIASGAAAILTDIYDPFLKNIVQIIHPDVSSIEAMLAAQYYQYASRDLFMVGITGTNGKTTTSFLTKHLLDNLRGPCGLIGTIEYIIGQHHYQATRTTPELISNHKMLREMVLQGCLSAVMEVTSHALDQGRVQNIEFDAAIYTNLSLDHLDYHQTMDKYAEAKQKLFRSLALKGGQKPISKSPYAIINKNCPWHEKIIEGCKGEIITYSASCPADLYADDVKMSSQGTHFTLHYHGKQKSAFCPLVGLFNVYNYLAALGAGIILQEAPIDYLIDILAQAPPVPGRLEPVPNDLGIKIYVDFAHSDDSLAKTLDCLKELKQKRLITVFGCGGDRDQLKRPKMAQASEAYSDLTIVTSDNPRSENPEIICRDIIKGFSNPHSYLVEVDRKQAIQKAIEIASSDDIVLIAGKGHETYQIFAHNTIEFDDRKIAAQFCKEKHLCSKG